MREQSLLFFDLLRNLKKLVRRKIAASPTRAVDTTARGAFAVDVGTGQTRINGKLCTLSAKLLVQIVGVSVIPLVGIAVRKGVLRCLCHVKIPLSLFLIGSG